MPSFQYWFTGTALYVAVSCAFATVLALIGIKQLLSRRIFASAIVITLLISAWAWWGAAKSESDNARRDEQLAAITDSLKLVSPETKIDERAMIGLVKLDSFDFKVGPNFSIPFDVSNTGRTPALNVRTRTMLKTIERGTTFIPNYPEPKMMPSISVIAPQVHMLLTTLPVEVSASQFADIANGRGILYAYGQILYDDIFGGSHETTFCIRYTAGLSAPVQCETYNSAK